MIWTVDPLKFWLVLMRLSSFALVAPGLKEIPAPRICKALLVVWLAFALAPAAGESGPSIVRPDAVVFDLAGEVFIGLSMGLVLRLVFSAIQFAGALLDNEFGFMAAQQFGAAVFEGDGILGRWLVWVAFFYFWALDYFSIVILGVGRSFALVPLGAFRLGGDGLSDLIVLGSSIFAGGLTIAAPIVALMFVVNLGFGLVTRAIQGVPIFSESFILRILAGWSGVLVFLPLLLLLVRARLEAIIPALGSHLAHLNRAAAS